MAPPSTSPRRFHVKRHFFAFLSLFLLCLSWPCNFVAANLLLPTGQVLTSFDIDWRFREARTFSLSGVIHSNINFTAPECSASPTAAAFNATDIIHVHLPSFAHAECTDAASIVDALRNLWIAKDGRANFTFAAVLITFNLDQESLGDEIKTPWGNPSLLDETEFQISVGPLSTAEALWSYTSNYVTTPFVQLTSDAGDWNEYIGGTPYRIYYGVLLVVYALLFGYATYLHVDSYRTFGNCASSFSIKSWVFVFTQLFIVFQVLAVWLPIYPYTLSQFFFWYCHVFAYVAYTLVLLTWVRIVSHDRSAKSALPEETAKAIHYFSYFAIVYFFLIMTAAILAGAMPQYKELILLRKIFFYSLPPLLITQAALFTFYGARLMRLLKTFRITEEKRWLLRRMSIIVAGTVACFLFVTMMAIVVIFAHESVIAAWIVRVFRDFSLILLVVVIFTLHAGTGKKRNSTSSAGIGILQIRTSKNPDMNGSARPLSAIMMSAHEAVDGGVSKKESSEEGLQSIDTKEPPSNP